MLALRPHHLLCCLTYIGKGYTAAFTANFNLIIQRLQQGEPITIVNGIDDICRPLCDTGDNHCQQASVKQRDRLAAKQISQLLSMPMSTGSLLQLDKVMIGRLQHAFAAKLIRQACLACQWSPLCEQVANDQFKGTLAPIPVTDLS